MQFFWTGFDINGKMEMEIDYVEFEIWRVAAVGCCRKGWVGTVHILTTTHTVSVAYLRYHTLGNNTNKNDLIFALEYLFSLFDGH